MQKCTRLFAFIHLPIGNKIYSSKNFNVLYRTHLPIELNRDEYDKLRLKHFKSNIRETLFNLFLESKKLVKYKHIWKQGHSDWYMHFKNKKAYLQWVHINEVYGTHDDSIYSSLNWKIETIFTSDNV